MGKLNTGWRHWDKHLSRFVDLDEPIHALEIGSYEGDATMWFLNNLCAKNKASTMTCVDTWEGSPEYVNINFMDVEAKFDANMAKTGQVDKVIKVKSLSYAGLVKLLSKPKRPEFHVIFIDASHEARDVLADAVLSWPMLKRGGVLIFDDYKWQKLSPEYFRPKPAIDAFMLCMKPELNVLDIQYQVLVEKRMEFETPVRSLENHPPFIPKKFDPTKRQWQKSGPESHSRRNDQRSENKSAAPATSNKIANKSNSDSKSASSAHTGAGYDRNRNRADGDGHGYPNSINGEGNRSATYDCVKLHKDIETKLNAAGIECKLNVKKLADLNPAHAKFIAITCLFRMSNLYRPFNKYIDQLDESCVENKNNPIIIRVYYDDSTEEDIRAAEFSRYKNIELVKYEFPQMKDPAGGHQGTFGTFMRQLSLFNFAHNSLICTSFDADMLLNYKEIMRCVAAMNQYAAPYFTLYDDNLTFDNIAERVGTNVFDAFIMATYIAQTNKLNLPHTILTDFLHAALNSDKKVMDWIRKNKHIRSNMKSKTNFIYGIDEFFTNSYLLPYVHARYNVIGTRLYIYVRHVHYELYKAIKAKKISSEGESLIVEELNKIFAKFEVYSADIEELIGKVDAVMDKKIDIFKSLNINILVLKQYLDLLIDIKNKGLVKFSPKYVEYLEYNERSTYVDDIFLIKYTSKEAVGGMVSALYSRFIYGGGKAKDATTWIIVPFADLHPEQKRAEQLNKFMAHMNQLHNKIPILVAEQVAPKLFNKGQLYNIAVEWLGDHLRKNIANTHLASESFGDITLILHDVDILPDAKMYARYSAPDLETPSQMIPITEYFKQIYDPKYPIPVGGGVTAIKMSDYIKVNGFPNHFAGWGGEDNAFQQRLKSNKIYYHYNEIGDFRTTDIQRTDIHSKKKYIDAADIQNKKMNELRMQDRNNWSNSGLNQLSQLNYKINTQKESGLISQIQITCDNNAGGSIGRSIKGATATAAPANISNVTATIDVLIVVPFADFKPEQKRAEQLAKFKKHMAGLIQELNYAGKINIIVAEQISQKNYFNRGQLLNAGIKWYTENVAKPRFVILHDVDMLPDKTLFAQYFKSKSPISLVPQDEDYKKTYGKIILAAGGGIFGLPYVDFIKCNGFPNSFWSWGGEDDAFSRRLANVGVRRFARVKNGHIHHIDVQRESHQTKMDYLRKNQIRSMMVHENLDRDSKEWREDGIADVKAMPKSTQVIGLDDPKVDTVYQVKYELAPTGLDEFISHNERVYKTLDKS